MELGDLRQKIFNGMATMNSKENKNPTQLVDGPYQTNHGSEQYGSHPNGNGVLGMNDESVNTGNGKEAHSTSPYPHPKSGQQQKIFNDASGEELLSRYDFTKPIHGLQRHILLIILSALLLAALGVYISYRLAKTYKAEAILLYQEDKPKVSAEGQALISFSMLTTIDMIKLASNFETVKTILGLDIPTTELQKMVTVPVPSESTSFIRIDAKSENPTLAVDLVNTLAKVVTKNTQDFYQTQLAVQKDVFKKLAGEVQEKLAIQSKQIEQFKKENQYYETNPEHSSVLAEIAELRSKLLNASLLYNSLIVEYDSLKSESENIPEHFISEISGVDSATMSPLESQINALTTQLIEARSKYSPTNPKVKILEEQLTVLQKKSLDESTNKSQDSLAYQKSKNLFKEKMNVRLLEMQSKVRSAQKQKEDLQAQLVLREKILETLPQMQSAFAQMLQNKSILEGDLKNLNTATQSIDLMLSTPGGGGLSVYQMAQKALPLVNSLPFGPSLLELLPLAFLILGTGLGVGLSFFLESKDSKICTIKQFECYYKLPVLTLIPEISFLSKKNGEEKTLYYIRNLLEHLNYVTKGTNINTLTVTSAIDDEGKSSLAYYLALYCQRIGRKVILLNFDYKKNNLTNNSQKPAAYLESYLKGNDNLNEMIINDGVDHIDLGENEIGLKELIKTPRMSQLMNTLRQTYEVIIIDAPGVIKNDYALNLASMTDGSLYVIGSNKTDKKYIDAAFKEFELNGFKPTGVVLNRVNPVYIDDVNIKEESRRSTKRFFQTLFTRTKKTTNLPEKP